MPTVKQSSNLTRQAKVFALFGDPTRLKILQILGKNKPAKVSELAQGVNMSVACISHHLQLLKDNGVVTAEREGNSIYYQLTDDPMVKKLQPLIK